MLPLLSNCQSLVRQHDSVKMAAWQIYYWTVWDVLRGKGWAEVSIKRCADFRKLQLFYLNGDHWSFTFSLARSSIFSPILLFHRILAFACPTSLPFLPCNASRPLSWFLLPTFYSIFHTPHHPLISSWKLSWCFSPPSSSPASNYQTRFYLSLSHILSSSPCAFTVPCLAFTVFLPVS